MFGLIRDQQSGKGALRHTGSGFPGLYQMRGTGVSKERLCVLNGTVISSLYHSERVEAKVDPFSGAC